MFSKKLVIVLPMALCMFFVASMSALAVEADDISGTWTVHAFWVDPESRGEYEMYVTMDNPFIGTFTTSEGSSGSIINIIIYVRWIVTSLDVRPVYQGLVFGNLGFGEMENELPNHGIWWAIRQPAGL
jgi:hypothetical protein